MISLNATFSELLKLPWLVLKEICSSAQSKIILFSTLKGFKEGLKIFLRPPYVLAYVIFQLLIWHGTAYPLIQLWEGITVWWLYTLMRPSVERKNISYAFHYILLIPIFFSVALAIDYLLPESILNILWRWSIDWVSFAPCAFFILSWLDKQLRLRELFSAIKQSLILSYMHLPIIIAIIILHKILLVLGFGLILIVSRLVFYLISFFHVISKSYQLAAFNTYIPLVWSIIWWILSTLFLISLWVTLYTIAVHNHKKIGRGLR